MSRNNIRQESGQVNMDTFLPKSDFQFDCVKALLAKDNDYASDNGCS